jgi:GNAT superfamily N-acetyltransferase
MGGFDLRPVTADDHAALLSAYSRIVEERNGFPHAPPLSRAEFDDCWLHHSSAVWVVTRDEHLAGAYYVKPNFVGRAAHIANAGYFVAEPFRRQGLGRALVEHSLHAARGLGFDAMQFNLVFASNPARAMYRSLGFVEIGRVPAAVEGEDAVIYWRDLVREGP